MGRNSSDKRIHHLDGAVVMACLRGPIGPARARSACEALRLDFVATAADVAAARELTIDQHGPAALAFLVAGEPAGRACAEIAVRTALDLSDAFLSLRNRWMGQRPDLAARAASVVSVALGPVRLRAGSVEAVSGALRGPTVDAARHLCGVGEDGEVLLSREVPARIGAALGGDLELVERPVAGASGGVAYRCRRRRARLHLVAR